MNQPVNTTIAKGKDWILIWLYVILVVFGLICIFSVEFKTDDDVLKSLFEFKKNYSKQLIFFGLSIVLAIFILLMDSKFFTATPNLLYIFGVILMLATFAIGKNVNGSHSWIPLGFMNLQPVELCKIFTALALAKYLSRSETDFSKPKSQLIAAGICFLPAVFSILQNETGLALVYFSFLIPMYREGLPPGYLIAGASLGVLLVVTLLFPASSLIIAMSILAGLIIYFSRRKIKRDKGWLMLIVGLWLLAVSFVGFVVPFMFRHVFQKYQADRIFSLVGRDNPFVSDSTANLNPATDPSKKSKKLENYNVKQSKIAIGSGGVLGKGFLKGTQTQGDFVPEQHTDFIFTSVGENFGFAGSVFLMLLYFGMMLRMVTIAERQRSTFSRVYAYSVVGIIFFHVAINICMTIGLAPVIGITLPLMSYGGSSLLTFTILIFILIKLDSDRQMVLR
ncbi:MAG: rod shape-determining protein RodA [Chitinophagaceae bacterium]|nr:rod shape-determining protein RodA [Bacteroidota bacterium]MCC6258860.1 rod shape-determining protein RodA [Chitinophagaceae bacterium]MCW5916093.1 rod shape-determining protein RodA [Ferruginibacter sp.]